MGPGIVQHAWDMDGYGQAEEVSFEDVMATLHKELVWLPATQGLLSLLLIVDVLNDSLNVDRTSSTANSLLVSREFPYMVPQNR